MSSIDSTVAADDEDDATTPLNGAREPDLAIVSSTLLAARTYCTQRKGTHLFYLFGGWLSVLEKMAKNL